MDRCPTHPEYPADDCGACERLIELTEYERDHGRNDREWQVGQDRYERWLDEIGGSR
jgi:hypothetical protein